MTPYHPDPRSVDVTGLSDAAIAAVEALVAVLREEAGDMAGRRPPDDWCRALREWAAGHRRLEHPADWSRDAIYAGRGE